MLKQYSSVLFFLYSLGSTANALDLGPPLKDDVTFNEQTRALHDCIHAGVLEYDDGTSSIEIIAKVIEDRCSLLAKVHTVYLAEQYEIYREKNPNSLTWNKAEDLRKAEENIELPIRVYRAILETRVKNKKKKGLTHRTHKGSLFHAR